MTIHCESCGTKLRQDAGVHRAGEPMMQRLGDDRFIPCPTCGHRQPYDDGSGSSDTPAGDPGHVNTAKRATS